MMPTDAGKRDIMRDCALALTAVMLLAGQGCSAGPDVVTLQPVDPAAATAEAPEAASTTWGGLASAVPVDESERTKYHSASEARKCPSLALTTVMGNETKLRPGQSGFAEPGTVTLVVFWGMEFAEGRAAARHVSDLVRKYRELGVRGLGVVERTRQAPASESFAAQYGLAFPIYYDMLEALKAMRKAAGAEDELGKLVAVFIVDRKMRVRFYRGEFPFSDVTGGILQPGERELKESAAEGRAIENYLGAILNEPY